QGDADGNTYTITATTIMRGGAATITYATMESLNVSAGAGVDTVTLTSAASVNTTINAGASGDSVTVLGTGALANTTINGEAGTETITIRTTAAGSATAVNGGDDSDTVNIGNAADSLDGILGEVCVFGDDHDAGATMAASVTAKGAIVALTLPVGDTLNVNDQGDASANTYSLTATTVMRGGAATITYATTESVNINAGSAANDIDIVTTPAASKTTVTSQEAADDIDVTTTGAGSILIINAAGGADAVDIATTGATSVTIVNGGDGTDTLTQVTSGTSSGVALNGQGDADTITIQNAGATSSSLATGGAADDGITLWNLPASSFAQMDGDDGNDIITLGSPANVISGILGQVQVNGGDHLAAPTMTDSVTAKGNTISRTLPVGDMLNINDQAYAAAAQYNLTDTMFDRDTTVARTMYATIETINLNAGTLVNDINVINTPADSKTTVTSQGGADDIDVTTTGTGSILIINAAGGADAVDIATTGGDSVTIVNGDDGTDTLTQVTSGASSGVALNGQGDADTITIQNAGATSSSLATGGADNDGITLWNLPASSFAQMDGDDGLAQMDGDDDNDVFTLGFPANVISGILGQVQVNGGNHLAVGGAPTHPAMIIKGDSSGALLVGDTLNVNDQAFAAAAQYNLTDTMFDRDTTVARTMYATVETVKLNAGTLANGINIANTVAGGTTTINGGSAVDTVIVTTTGNDSNLVINTAAGSDIVTIVGTGTDGADPNNSAGDNAIGSFLEVNGGAEAAPAGDTITLVANGVASRVQLDGEAGDDILNVQSTATGSRTQVSGDAGNDTINVSSDAPANLGNVNGIAGELMVDGGNNGPELRTIIYNATAGFSTALMGGSSAAATTVTIPLMTIPNLPAATPFQINVEGEDMLVNSVTTNAASMSLMVTRGADAVAHANNDAVVLEVFTHVTSGSCVAAPVFIKQEATIDVWDSLNISDAGEAMAHAYEIDNNSVDRSGGPSVAYMSIEALNLFAGSAVDAASVTMPTAPFTIANPALPSIVSFDGGGTDGADKIIVGSKATDPATRSPFEINEVEFVKLRGGNASPVLPNSDTGFDDLVNMTGARGLLEGFAGNDIHFGGSDIDVIAAGAGADFLAGNGGNDYLFADVDLVNTTPVTGVERIPDPTGLGDLLDGGAGINTGFQKGSLDIAAGIGGVSELGNTGDALPPRSFTNSTSLISNGERVAGSVALLPTMILSAPSVPRPLS
ncbi:MAG: hypothetical protein HYV60_01320, partial [Planctomycetia bacterium]|nr:hypothetical protein [Planctomycetia bacterium]